VQQLEEGSVLISLRATPGGVGFKNREEVVTARMSGLTCCKSTDGGGRSSMWFWATKASTTSMIFCVRDNPPGLLDLVKDKADSAGNAEFKSGSVY